MFVVWLLLPAIATAGLFSAASALVARHRVLRVVALMQAAGLAVASVALTLYVAAEDDYRSDGTSRWEAYDVKELTVVAVAVGGLAVAALVWASATQRRGPAIGGFVASSAAAALQFAAMIANTVN